MTKKSDKPKRRLQLSLRSLLVVTAIVSLFAAFVATRYLTFKRILVAKEDVERGAALTLENTEFEFWPISEIPYLAVANSNLLKGKGKYAATRFCAGQPILLRPAQRPIPQSSSVIVIELAIGEGRMVSDAEAVDVIKRGSGAQPVDRVLAKGVFVYATDHVAGRGARLVVMGTKQQIEAIRAVDGPYGIDWVLDDVGLLYQRLIE